MKDDVFKYTPTEGGNFLKLASSAREVLSSHGMWRSDLRLGVALSGGVDSVALLYVLRKIFPGVLSVVHCNHGLRGEESDEDERFCRKLAEKFEIPFYVERFTKGSGNTQDDARRKRMSFFRRLLNEGVVDVIATAHHKNDRVEHFFIKLLRGSGGDSLGFSPVGDGIIRPFCNVWRRDIEKFVEEEGIEYREDRTNAANSYLRNYLRHEILPRLRRTPHGSLDEHVLTLADILSVEGDFMERAADNYVSEHSFLEKTDKKAVLSTGRGDFNSLHPAIKFRVLRKAWRLVGGLGDGPGFEHLKMASALIENGKPGAVVQFPEGVELWVDRDVISILKGSFKKKSSDLLFKINKLPMKVKVKNIEIEFFKTKEINDKTAVYLPLDLMDRGLCVRFYRPGDWIRPSGMGGKKKKLGDLFTDKKVPLRIRKALPLLAVGGSGEILFVPGLALADGCSFSDLEGKSEFLCIKGLPRPGKGLQFIEK